VLGAAGAAAAVLLSIACSSTPAAPPPAPQHVQAMLLVYSGRPNPTFRLDEAAVARLGELLAATTANPAFPGATVTPSILGYQGVLVVNGARAAGLPEALAVHGEDVETHDGKAVSFHKDARRGLETFLLDQAIEHEAITREALARIRR
jgi:hypothetical protein